ncbi:MAG TPA: hypothetical protein VMD99_08670 [Terriglobales bacterium]|jgi:hypothetical protein|nr:hypothetical protein [Terriglobales bacterium]
MKTQAWGWLVAGVMALGLNGFYQDGGFASAHRAVYEIERNTGAVLALASGRADQFLAEVQPVAAREETAACPLATALAQVQTKVARVQTRFASSESARDRVQAELDVMSARQQAAVDRWQGQWEANQARLEARVARLRIPAADFNPVVFVKAPACPRIHVNISRPPMIKLPELPSIHLDAGPV